MIDYWFNRREYTKKCRKNKYWHIVYSSLVFSHTWSCFQSAFFVPAGKMARRKVVWAHG